MGAEHSGIVNEGFCVSLEIANGKYIATIPSILPQQQWQVRIQLEHQSGVSEDHHPDNQMHTDIRGHIRIVQSMVLVGYGLGGWLHVWWDLCGMSGTKRSQDDIEALDDARALFKVGGHRMP